MPLINTNSPVQLPLNNWPENNPLSNPIAGAAKARVATTAIVSTMVVSELMNQGKLVSASTSSAPGIKEPAVEANSGLLVQQFQSVSGKIQFPQIGKDQAQQNISGISTRPTGVGDIDFSAPNVQRNDSSAAGQSYQQQDEHGRAGSGLLGGALSAQTQLIGQLIQNETKMRNADKTQSVEHSKLSMAATKLAADKEIDSGKARRNELITGAATNFAMTGVGTARAQKGIKTQKTALKTHKVNSLEHQNMSRSLEHAGRVKTGSAGITKPVVAGNTRPVADTSERIQSDHMAVNRPAQLSQQRAQLEEIESQNMHMTGQRHLQHGQALTASAGAAGGLAGAQFGMDASQAQSDKQLAEGNSRIQDATMGQKQKEAEAAQAVLSALLAAIAQIATNITEAGGAIAANTAR